MSSKERNQVNLAQSVSQFLSTTTDPTQQGFAICWVWGCQLELEEVLCRAGCTATGHIGLEVPVSTGGFVQSQVSGKGQDKKHLTPCCSFLPPAAIHAGKCAAGVIKTRHTKGPIALSTLSADAQQIILLQGKTVFILLMIPDTLPGCCILACGSNGTRVFNRHHWLVSATHIRDS